MSVIHAGPTCMANCWAAPASGFLLCWEHWAQLPKSIRDAAWDARKRSRESADPDARATALAEIERFKRDMPAYLNPKVLP